jgi:phage terminase small subunit
MPILKNPKHERFAQELAQGKNADKAYQDAGFKPNRGNACTLKAKQSVLDRVAELQQRCAERAEITKGALIAELDEALKIAIEDRNPNAIVAAVKEKAILSGKRVERSETGQPGEFDDIEMMGADELRRFIADTAERVKAPRLN